MSATSQRTLRLCIEIGAQLGEHRLTQRRREAKELESNHDHRYCRCQ